LKTYKASKAYYKRDGKALVSTFGGESVADDRWAALKNAVTDIIVVPGYERAQATNDFFDSRRSLDGVFNWNSWLPTSAGKGIVSTKDDEIFQTAARDAKKIFMMGMSPVQFKHLSQGDNWYRRGEDNLEYRFGQVLEMQPDMLQLQTWNDAGEGHYMGNLWPEPMTVSEQIQTLVANREHTGYWQVLRSFIDAWKRGDRTTANMVPTNGQDVQGTFWHHTLTVDASCGTAELPKSGDITKVAEDAVSGIVLVAKGKTGLVAVVKTGDKELGQLKLEPGFNKFKFGGLVPGKVQVEVWSGSTMVGGGYGKLEVRTNCLLLFVLSVDANRVAGQGLWQCLQLRIPGCWVSRLDVPFFDVRRCDGLEAVGDLCSCSSCIYFFFTSRLSAWLCELRSIESQTYRLYISM
jgi:glucan endo-1,3-alpha-glucosidase